MKREWTFGQKIAGGFSAIVALTIVIGVTAVLAIRSVNEAEERVVSVNARILIDAERANTLAERKVVNVRGFLLTGEQKHMEKMRSARADLLTVLEQLRSSAPSTDTAKTVERLVQAEAQHQLTVESALAMRQSGASMDAVLKEFDDRVVPKFEELRREMAAFVSSETRNMEEAARAASGRAIQTTNVLMILIAIVVACAAVLGWLLSRTLAAQVGMAVQHIQSSSAELQAVANQQATGAREQASAMTEITTTIRELLSTSRQIAEGAQRVARIADDTASAARSGDQVVHRTQDAVSSIKRQVDLIVTHMLDLGRKSQQIGGILELINELSEQTNILAINATIEAVGAGETGKRFAVVADEIRKLADRVGGSTKEIRTLVDEIRSAVNTTVMATEGGSKAVDAGTRQFGDVTASLKQIVGLVGTTTEAAREIELSTKQQSTAVEQVTVAVADVAQATKETETSSGQMLQTSSQLTNLSRDLMRLVQRQAAA
jgi:methyl-accepting chemotaxis protein